MTRLVWAALLAAATSGGHEDSFAPLHRLTTEKRQVRGKGGKMTTKTVKSRTPFTFLIRDERMVPERAIPAAAAYLARLDHNLGGRDWAIFAYHCGPGCVGNMQELTE